MTERAKRRLGVITHGRSMTPLYFAWRSMLTRCESPNHRTYDGYGSRGIKVCDRWHSFENFLADMGERPEGMQLERINNDGDYCPENCRWASVKEQARNRRNQVICEFQGITLPLWRWLELAGGPSYYRVSQRLKKGWPMDAALFGPKSVLLRKLNVAAVVPPSFYESLEARHG